MKEKKVPSFIKKPYDPEVINNLFAYGERELYQQHEETARYGLLSIDEAKGTFIICKGEKIKPDDKYATFHVLDLTQPAIYCVDPMAKGRNVYADVVFSGNIECIKLKFKVTIAYRVSCRCTSKNDYQMLWDEPGELSMFRSMFNQMARNEYEKRQMTFIAGQRDIVLYQAKCAFLLGEEFTTEELEMQYKRLLASFVGTTYEPVIKYYHNILSACAI